MNFIVAEDPNNAITDVMSVVRSKYPNSSVYRINKDNFDQAIKVVKNPPMLTNHWLVVINPNRMTVSQARRIGELNNNLNIFNVVRSNDLDTVKDLMEKAELDYQYLDNLHPSRQTIIDYIMKELQVDEKLAKYIGKRCNYYIPRVYESVLLLSIVDEQISKSVVSKYTTNYGTASISTLVEHIIGYEHKAIRPLLNLIDNYRHGTHFLFKTIKEELENILTGYELIMSGQLSLKNYTTFKSDELKVSAWKLKKILDYYQTVSFEKLYFIYVMFCREENEDVPTLLKYIKSGGV